MPRNLQTVDPAPASLDIRLMMIDPKELRSSDQIREDATPDDQLVASVRASGILQPPTVVWNDQLEAYYIVFGHRRVGAAIMAGAEEIPVIVRDPASITAVVTLEEQIVENERRKGITQREIARGWANLEGLFGQTPEDIAAAVQEKPERVRAGIRSVQSEKTHQLLADVPALDLERAAILTEFDEHPEAQQLLVQVATNKPHEFESYVRSQRAKLEKEARTAEIKKELRAAKVKLAKIDGYGGLKSGAARITSLVDAETGKKLTVKGHASCPGHAGLISGWSAEDLEVEYVCNDFKANGHKFPGPEPRELSAEQQREEAERAAARAMDEANRAARRQWIHDMLPGKINQLPGVYDYLAAALLDHGSSYYEDHRAPAWTLPFLGVEPHAHEEGVENSKRMDALLASKRVAPFRLMLATALGIHEKRIQYSVHRSAAVAIRHLTQLEKWGYPLTELDTQLLADAREALAAQQAEAAAREATVAAENEEAD